VKRSVLQLAALALVVLLLVGCSEDGGVPYSVAGRVVDSSGTGIPGVELAFSGDFGIAETDSAGQWQKVGLLGTVRITPYKAGWVFAARTVSGEDEGVVFVGHRVGTEEVAVQTPNFGHYAAITSGFKSFLMIALWYSLGGLSLRLP
jgi:hypothetical protein